MKITENLIPYTYKESKRVFENDLSVKEAAENMNKNCGININSSADYYYYFKYLKTGEGSCRILSSFTQEFYLKTMYDEYGREQLKKSLRYFKQLIEKFEGDKVGSKKSMWAIYSKYIDYV